MLFQLASFILLLSICYFVSRVLLRSGLFPASKQGLWLVHAVSAGGLLALVVLVKFWTPGFGSKTLIEIAICQLIWFGYDHFRGRQPGRGLG